MHNIKPGDEIGYSFEVEQWLLTCGGCDVGQLITTEMIYEGVNRGSLLILDNSIRIIELTEQGEAELRNEKTRRGITPPSF